jgi:hypothetical protein
MLLKIYSRRWSRGNDHWDNYTVERTEKGWRIGHIAIGGECNSRGEPYLFDNFSV